MQRALESYLPDPGCQTLTGKRSPLGSKPRPGRFARTPGFCFAVLWKGGDPDLGPARGDFLPNSDAGNPGTSSDGAVPARSLVLHPVGGLHDSRQAMAGEIRLMVRCFFGATVGAGVEILRKVVDLHGARG